MAEVSPFEKRPLPKKLAAVLVLAIVASIVVWMIDPHSFEPKEDSALSHRLASSLASNGVMSRNMYVNQGS